MITTPYPKLPSEADALLNLRNAYYQLQHHEVVLEDLWQGSNEGCSVRHQAFVDRQLKELADQADRVRATLDLVQSIRRYGHLINEAQGLSR